MKSKRALALAAAVVLAIGGPAARAEFITVYGGPTFDAATGSGFKDPVVPRQQYGVNDGGTAVAYADTSGGLGHRGLRWDASDAPAIELGNLGTAASGRTDTFALAIDANGTVVGYGDKFTGNTNEGTRAVRWNAGDTAAIELGNLGTNSSGVTSAFAFAVNSSGTAVGEATKYSGNASLGTRAVRWDASGTAATELGSIGTNLSGGGNASAIAVNDSGTVVGNAFKFNGNTLLGNRAVKWDAGSTAATELGNLGTDASDTTDVRALAVNAAGTTVGTASKYSGTTFLGGRAVRWDAGSTTATELGNLGTDARGFTVGASALAVNADGTAVGVAAKYSGGAHLGSRAVRWDGGGTAATELGNLGTTVSGVSDTRAFAVNTDGAAVGYAFRYTAGIFVGQRAVLWRLDGKAIDLNTLIDPASGWTLTEADTLSDTNFVAGVGSFDPDGPGPLGAYQRAFVMNVSSVVPEPSSVGVMAVAVVTQLRRVGRAGRLGKRKRADGPQCGPYGKGGMSNET